MSARPKLTDEQIAFARYVMNRKRELLRQLKLMPTLDDLADELGCSRRYLASIVTNKVRVFLVKHHRQCTIRCDK